MSRGKKLNEMEAGTKQSRTAVNAGAKAGDPMQKLAPGAVAGQTGGWEDLGGPTPDNYRPDDESATLKTPGASLKPVKNVVNRGAKAADAMQKLTGHGVKEESEEDETLEDVSEEEMEMDETQEVVSEEEMDSEEEVDSEETVSEEEEVDSEETVSEEDEVSSDEYEYVIEYNAEEDVQALVEGEDLSEEFQEKARTIFEAALKSKVDEIHEGLVEYYNQYYENRLVEEVENIKTVLEERVDSYLEYVAEEWMVENELAIENGLKTDMTESFLVGMKSLFEEHYVSIPEEKYDVVYGMAEKLDEMETKLNEQIEKNISLNKRLSESVAEGIFDNVSEGLALSQKEKLASLIESVEFESETQYRDKLEVLKESYFPTKSASPEAKTETLNEGVDVTPEIQSPSMESYLRALQGVAKN